MTIEKKLLGTNPSGGAVNVADVFSTYLYTGTQVSHTITNGIDLAGEGGMVWTKARSDLKSNAVFDTERGPTKVVQTDKTQAEYTSATALTSFNSNGFTVQDSTANDSPQTFVAWTFRKAPKFFDVVTYTGNGSNRTIAHGLGVAAGMIMVKRTDAAGSWMTYHRSLANTENLVINTTAAKVTNATAWNSTTSTDAVFSLGTHADVNTNAATYVAYLFADNTAEDADEQMIKCGSYTGNSSSFPVIDLGWEPQYVLIKKSGVNTRDWFVVDSMRGISSYGSKKLSPNLFYGEASSNFIALNASGFEATSTSQDQNGVGETYIYMAIRAPMMKEPSAGTEVFAVDTADGTPSYTSGFVTDFGINKTVTSSSSDPLTASRLTGTGILRTSSTAAETSDSSRSWDYMNGYLDSQGTSVNAFAWMWKRAKGYFDVVAYTGNGPSNRYVNHSLGVVPEMIWVKNRGATYGWPVYHKTLTAYKYLYLESDADAGANDFAWGNIEPTETQFHVDNNANGAADVNASGNNYVAYLFATLAGVSKVGSYTGNGNSQTIDCGFAAGARFILIKRYDTVSTGDWYIWDTARGIVAGNDPHLSLNTTAAQVSDDSIDPANSGFSVNQISATNINVNSASYIFYAIA